MTTDLLSDVLQLLRPRAYGFRGLEIGGNWSLCLPPQPVVRCYALRSGACGLWLDGVAPVQLAAGDFVLLPQGQGLVIGSRPDAPRVDLKRFFTTASGDTAVFKEDGDCSGLGGYFEMTGMAADQLLQALPPVVRLGASADSSGLLWLVDRLMAELRTPRPGGRLIAKPHPTLTLADIPSKRLNNKMDLFIRAGSRLDAMRCSRKPTIRKRLQRVAWDGRSGRHWMRFYSQTIFCGARLDPRCQYRSITMSRHFTQWI